MNSKLSIKYFILIITSLFFSCCGGVKNENKSNAPASALSLHIGNEKYIIIDEKESVVTWKGSSLKGVNPHKGYVHISKGELMIENSQLLGGTVEVDMNTIEDERHAHDNNLIKHLKNPDFFDVEKFPFSTIAITKVVSINDANKNVTGKLTIKGITHPVAFPVKMEVNNEIVKANGKLIIDRSKWDVSYKSAKFYDILANQTISDSIEFDIKIVAKK
ncbi:YceI family protein [Pedobacter sp. KBS0701]|uniref:YceI family protein n=1 Tax=Pedobacter sp. KBS0701 TaxID=2578106 RepID=UPI00110F18BC|nr:YceI family protein [Pedobacter sp. KBS0701]QDW23996.1 YceI family protein [Pedobacter sp. KBS0701]